MRTYIGRRDDGDVEVVVVDENGVSRQLPRRLDIRNHSPTGFEWGYGGSGPAQLALALLCDYFETFHPEGNVNAALIMYQAFKFKVVGRLPEPGKADEWRLTTEDIRTFVDEFRKADADVAQ